MFLQHALSCHVCHRSLFFIPINALVIGFPEEGGGGGGTRADVGGIWGLYGDFIKTLSPSGGGNVGTLLLVDGEKIGNEFLFLNIKVSVNI